MTPEIYIDAYFPIVMIMLVMVSLAVGYAYGFLDGKNYEHNKKSPKR